MFSFIAAAHAADISAGPAQGAGYMEIGILVFFFAMFYLMIWRPQAKRAKEHRNLIGGLSKNDEVVVGGGMLGKISDIDEQYITLKIAEGTTVRYQRQAVTQVLPKGSLKGL